MGSTCKIRKCFCWKFPMTLYIGYRRQSATRTLGMDLIFPFALASQSYLYQIGNKWESSLRPSPHLFNRLYQSNRLSSSGGSKHEIWSRAWRSWNNLLDRLLLFAVQISIVKETENKKKTYYLSLTLCMSRLKVNFKSKKSPLHVAEPKKYNTDLVNVNDQAL